MLEATAKSIVSRAKEALGEFAEAIRLSSDVLAFADANEDEALATDALVSLGPQLESVGRLPEALHTYTRSAAIYRRNQAIPDLAYALARQSELLIVLGRGKEAEAPLAELEQGIATKADTNVNRPRRVARLRALLAVIEGRFDDVQKHATLARVAGQTKPDDSHLSASVLAEYAAARLGRSQTPVATMALWLQGASSPEARREMSYWAAQTLRARGENTRAHDLAQGALAEAASRLNPELRWRLAALANLTAPTQIGATMPPHATGDDIQKLKTLWGAYDSTPYFNRADLKPLLR
jgi:tetratricopeptide (TPR) repeat protein